MKRIAITGLSGVIGQILLEEMDKSLDVIDLFHTRPYLNSIKIKEHQNLDLLDKAKIEEILEKTKPSVVIHMAAVTHIDRCQADKKRGKNGKVWKINVAASGEVAKFCAKHKVPIIFLSTECVFDGKKEFFSENSLKNPINWYGETKSVAEDLILESGTQASIIRSVVAYHKNDDNKTIYGKILSELKSKNRVQAVDDQFFTPTYTYDIAHAINLILKNKLQGIYHVAPKKNLSPLDFALLIAERNGYSKSLVKGTSLKSFYGNERSSLRLRNASLLGLKTEKVLKFIPIDPENTI